MATIANLADVRTLTLTVDQMLAYCEGGFPALRVQEDCLEDIARAGMDGPVAVLDADEMCVLFWITDQGVQV